MNTYWLILICLRQQSSKVLYVFMSMGIFHENTNYFISISAISALQLFSSTTLYYKFLYFSDFFTTEPIPLLQNRFCLLKSRFLYYRVTESISLLLYYWIDFFTTELQSRFLYYRMDFFTTEWISLLQVDFFTSESISLISLLQNFRTDFFTTRSISLLRNRFLYFRIFRIDFFTT